MEADARRERFFSWKAAAVAALLAAAAALPAAAARMSVVTADGFDPGSTKRVAFIPLVRIEPPAQAESARCPLEDRAFDPCMIEDAAEAELSRSLGRALLESDAPVEWVDQAEINAAREKLKRQSPGGYDSRGGWQMAVGREVGADAVLFGFIYCYRDRSGNAFATSRAAALGFCLHLVDPATGAVLWSMRYQDEQRALFDDLLSLPEFFRRGCKWIRVEAMSGEAAAKLAASLPFVSGSAPASIGPRL